jgi:hypothetical protein
LKASGATVPGIAKKPEKLQSDGLDQILVLFDRRKAAKSRIQPRAKADAAISLKAVKPSSRISQKLIAAAIKNTTAAARIGQRYLSFFVMVCPPQE